MRQEHGERSPCSHSIVVMTGYGIGIPTHVGENHHHITACATHVIGYGDSLPVPNQHIQTYQACSNYDIICFKFHVSSI